MCCGSQEWVVELGSSKRCVKCWSWIATDSTWWTSSRGWTCWYGRTTRRGLRRVCPRVPSLCPFSPGPSIYRRCDCERPSIPERLRPLTNPLTSLRLCYPMMWLSYSIFIQQGDQEFIINRVCHQMTKTNMAHWLLKIILITLKSWQVSMIFGLLEALPTFNWPMVVTQLWFQSSVNLCDSMLTYLL